LFDTLHKKNYNILEIKRTPKIFFDFVIRKMSERIVTRINGSNGKGDDSAKTLLIIIVAAVAVAIFWYLYKSSSSGSSFFPQTTLQARPLRPLRAVVSPAPPVVKATPAPPTPAPAPIPGGPPSEEKVKVVKVKANSTEPYEKFQLNQDTIEDPDFLMAIGRDPMTEVRNKVKTIDDLQYTTPQDLLGVDAVLQADAQMQAEDVSLHTGMSTMFGTGINTNANIRALGNPYAGNVPIVPAVTSQITTVGVSQSDRLNAGWAGLDTDNS
jgi:hypothetical protein